MFITQVSCDTFPMNELAFKISIAVVLVSQKIVLSSKTAAQSNFRASLFYDSRKCSIHHYYSVSLKILMEFFPHGKFKKDFFP